MKKIGKYIIEEEINRGGMGIVFRGLDEALNRPVAIKMLPQELFLKEDQKNRFKREAQIIAKLDHPHIMKIYSWEEAEETFWIAMELLEGQLLSQLIKEKGKLSFNESGKTLFQLSLALSYAHNKGIIHRDIKPSNVMIDPEGNVKLMDFGIARDEESDLNLTREGMILGTPKYMSPEQFTGATVDERSDIYSLGVMAYEMVTGKIPFEGRNLPEIAYKHINETPPPIKKHTPGIPPQLETFIMKAISKKPQDRHTSLSGIDFGITDDQTQTLGTIIAKRKIQKYQRTVILLSVLISLGIIALFIQINTKKQKKIDILSQEIQHLLKKKDWLKAKGKLAELSALTHNPERTASFQTKVQHLENMELNHTKAKTLFAEALKHLTLNDEKSFHTNLIKAIELDPENSTVYDQEAKKALNIYKKRKAEEHYEKGVRLVGINQQNESTKELKKCIELNPEHAEAYYLLAENLREDEDFDQKINQYIDYLEKSLLYAPNEELRWRNLALAYFQQKNFPKAIETLKKGMTHFPASIALKELLEGFEKKPS